MSRSSSFLSGAMLARSSRLVVFAGVVMASSNFLHGQVCVTYRATLVERVPPHLQFLGVDPEEAVEVSGTISYDLEAEAIVTETSARYRMSRLDITMRLGDVESVPVEIALRGHPLVTVTDSPAGEGADVVTFHGETTFDEVDPLDGLVLFSLELRDPGGSALDSLQLPRSLDAVRFAERGIETRTLPGDGRSLLFRAAVDAVDDCAPPLFRRGDVNDDGVVDLADPVRLFGFLFRGGDAPRCRKAGDANDDGGLDISDGIYTLDALFLGGPAIPEPRLSCGADPTFDTLPCSPSMTCP